MKVSKLTIFTNQTKVLMYSFFPKSTIFLILMHLGQYAFSSKIQYKEQDQIKEITPYVKYYIDNTNLLNTNQIQNLPKNLWKSLPYSNPLLHQSNSTYWITFSIINNSSFPLYLNLPYPWSDKIDFYFRPNSEQWSVIQSGFKRPAKARALPIHSYNFFLVSPGVEISVYLKILSDWVYIPILEVGKAELFYQNEIKANIWQGLYAGIMLALFLYNLNLWIILRESIYGLYLLNLVAVFLIAFHHSGLTCQYLWPCDKWIFFDWIVNIASGLTVILFTQTFLRLKKNAPVLSRLLWAIASTYIIYIILMQYENTKVLAGQIIRFNNTFAPMLILAGGLYVYFKKKYNPALFYLLGWSFFLISSIILFQIYAGNLKFNYYIFNVVELGSAIEAIFFSFALAARIRLLRKEKVIAEQEKIKKEMEFEVQKEINERKLLETEIKTQELERSRIAADLHDELGISLTMAKMAIQSIEKENLEQQLSLAVKNVDQSIVSFREIVHNLHPSVIGTFGLTTVIKKILENISQKYGIEIYSDIDTNLKFPSLIEIHVYRVFNELINNALKHSGASHLSVTLRRTYDNFYQLSVFDNGKGIQDGTLLRRVSSRLEILGGKYSINNQEEGTKIIITFPAENNG